MFQLREVKKTYSRRGNEVTALAAPALDVNMGEYAAIVGPSGSGKTTLLSVLGGMLTPNSGKVLLDGISLYDLSVARRAAFRRERI